MSNSWNFYTGRLSEGIQESGSPPIINKKKSDA